MNDQPPKPHEPQRTRLIEPVECGLSEEDRDACDFLRGCVMNAMFTDRPAPGYTEDYDRAIDLLDRLPGMIEDRDRELADAEYEALCARLEADTARQILADAIAQSNGSRDIQQSVTDGFENLTKTITRAWDERDRLQREIMRLRGLLDGESHG